MLDKYSWLTEEFLSQIAEIHVLHQDFSVKIPQRSDCQTQPDSDGEKVYDLRWVPYVFICLSPRLILLSPIFINQERQIGGCFYA
jgi:hypothetical protein